MARQFNRRKFLLYGSATWGTTILLKACANSSPPNTAATPTAFASPASNTTTSGGEDTIKVGILHSLSGTLSVSEKSVVDAELLAIEDEGKSYLKRAAALNQSTVGRRDT